MGPGRKPALSMGKTKPPESFESGKDRKYRENTIFREKTPASAFEPERASFSVLERGKQLWGPAKGGESTSETFRDPYGGVKRPGIERKNLQEPCKFMQNSD